MTSTRRSLIQAALALPASFVALAQESHDPVAQAAGGEAIPHPLSKKTYAVDDSGKLLDVPEGMSYIAAGKFTMGERQSAHDVWVDGFALGKYMVTNAEYHAFVAGAGGVRAPRHWRNGAYPVDKANHPVLWVSWNDAQKYCAWVSAGTSFKAALPTEAQWEKAARGPNGFQFPWGNDRSLQNLNYNGVCAGKYGLQVSSDGNVPGWREFTATQPYRELVDQGGYTTPVGAYPQGKSAFGCYDIAGNAWEWCADWYKQDYFKLPSAERNPQGPSREEADEVNRAAEHGKVKVIRGGSWYAHFGSARNLYREETRGPEGGYHSVGFRIAVVYG